VGNDDDLRSVVLGGQGAFAGMAPGSVLVDHTTASAAVARELALLAAERELAFVDAPVSGGVPGAVAGTLSIMAGAREPAVIDRAMPVFEALGKRVFRTGGLGSGHAMKALNNLVSCAGYLIGIEALIIGSKYGMDPEVMVDVLNHSTGMNNSTQKKFRQYVLSRKFDSGFPLKMMLKDIEIALGLAGEMNVPVPFARLCLDLWSSTQSMLGPDVDHTAMARGIEMLAGWQIPQTQTNCSATTT